MVRVRCGVVWCGVTGRFPSVGRQSGARRGRWDIGQGVWSLLQLLLVMCDKWLQIIIPWLFLLLQVGIKSSQHILSETWPNKADAILSQNMWGGVWGGFHYWLTGRWMNAPHASLNILFHLPDSFSWRSETFHTMSPVFQGYGRNKTWG